MKRLTRTAILLGLGLAVATASLTFAAGSAKEARVGGDLHDRIMQYSFPDETNFTIGTEEIPQKQPLGETSSDRQGRIIGNTWYEYQHNGSMGRMIGWGWDAANGPLIHFSWMELPAQPPPFVSRAYAYNCYYGPAGTMLGEMRLQPHNEYAGYVGLDVTADNRAVLGGHNDQGAGLQGHFYWDFAPGLAFFASHSRVPTATAPFPTIWPKFRYQESPACAGGPVTHVLAQVHNPMVGTPNPLMYYSKIGVDANGVWTAGVLVDATTHVAGHDVAVSDVSGKVALAWIAPVPGTSHTQLDNNLWYQVSNDCGVTWMPPVNLTGNILNGPGYRPYTDLSVLIDSYDDLHIGWNANWWPGQSPHGGRYALQRCRMFHWGENIGSIRTVADLMWDQTMCDGGAWQMNGSKMSISECDGRVYFLWVQFNDIPNGVFDDCALRCPNDCQGAANGELFLSVSDDYGLTWDPARNLTNTYTPGCDPAQTFDCESEHWPSMSPFGTDEPLAGTPGVDYVIVDPSMGYVGDWYLDVQYINDKEAGAAIHGEGNWYQDYVEWFRLACVDPVPGPLFTSLPRKIEYPTWTPHGIQLVVPVTIENYGNVPLNYTLTIVEDTGPIGWLTEAGFGPTGTIPAGFANTVAGLAVLNTAGIVNMPNTPVYLSGRFIFSGNHANAPYTIPIECWVTNTGLIAPGWNTIYAGHQNKDVICMALTVGNNGNFGNQSNTGWYADWDVSGRSGGEYPQGYGKANMDFYDYGDCDNDDDIPGRTEVYLNDGSPVICWTEDETVVCNWSIFGDDDKSEHGFFPMSPADPPVDMGEYFLFHSEFVTHDTGIRIEKDWVAPRATDDSCNFLIQKLRIYSNDGETHEGLTIAEAIDWDIPSDSAVRNESGFDHTRRLIYQQGGEFGQDDGVECQENSDRYGGISMVEIFENQIATHDFHGCYTLDNATYVYPNNGFVPDEMMQNIEVNPGPGYSIYTSPDPDSMYVDLHTVMTFKHDYDLSPEDTLVIYKCLVTTKDGLPDFLESVDACHQWYSDHLRPDPQTCCVPPIRGNVDNDPGDNIDISDLVYLVDYMFGGGPAPACFEEADMNCDGEIDISDLVWLVDYMFTGGFEPCRCDCADCP